MEDIFEKISNLLNDGIDVVWSIIVESNGSSPRSKNASMVVTKDSGRVLGTIGGGTIEYESERIALRLLEEKRSDVHEFILTPNEIEDIGMVCGGDVKVYFYYISHTDEEMVAKLKKGKLRIGYEDSGKYVTLSNRSEHVYIFGGGHITQAVVPVISRLGFHSTVCEDREDFARRELFPEVDEIRLLQMDELGNICKEMTKDDFVCIFTRGHKNDFEVLCQVLKTDISYIGVIGSRSKKKFVFDKLRNLGFTESDIARVKTPIGFDILAETPEEIAISVAAELIYVRAGGNTAFDLSKPEECR
ncbi:MAG: XdhC family protein [Clostridioides sp.]|nr:XdhC family protein [Clostridioides sp.]